VHEIWYNDALLPPFSILCLLGSCLTVELFVSTIAMQTCSRQTHDIPQLGVRFVKLFFQVFCFFAQLLQIIRYRLFHLDIIAIERISFSHHEPTRQPTTCIWWELTDIFPTPLYNFTSESSFGIALISLIVRFRIFRSFSFDWIWARTRDKARWDATAWQCQLD
jgi:hypothetical protein